MAWFNRYSKGKQKGSYFDLFLNFTIHSNCAKITSNHGYAFLVDYKDCSLISSGFSKVLSRYKKKCYSEMILSIIVILKYILVGWCILLTVLLGIFLLTNWYSRTRVHKDVKRRAKLCIVNNIGGHQFFDYSVLYYKVCLQLKLWLQHLFARTWLGNTNWVGFYNERYWLNNNIFKLRT